jgi:ATP-dependent DNA helicase RecG
MPTGPADAELAAFIAEGERQGHLDLRYLQVLHEMRSERRITTDRAAKLLQLGQDEARAELNGLVERGLLEARGERKGRTYHLAASVYRRLGDESSYVRTRGFDTLQHEQMIESYVRAHGSISRRDTAELCQLSPEQASSTLRSLSRRGKLTMRGERRGARYYLPDGES